MEEDKKHEQTEDKKNLQKEDCISEDGFWHDYERQLEIHRSFRLLFPE